MSDYTVDENLADVRSIAQRIHNRLPDHVLLRYVRDWMDVGPEVAPDPHKFWFRGYLCKQLVCEFIETLRRSWMDLNAH